MHAKVSGPSLVKNGLVHMMLNFPKSSSEDGTKSIVVSCNIPGNSLGRSVGKKILCQFFLRAIFLEHGDHYYL